MPALPSPWPKPGSGAVPGCWEGTRRSQTLLLQETRAARSSEAGQSQGKVIPRGQPQLPRGQAEHEQGGSGRTWGRFWGANRRRSPAGASRGRGSLLWASPAPAASGAARIAGLMSACKSAPRRGKADLHLLETFSGCHRPGVRLCAEAEPAPHLLRPAGLPWQRLERNRGGSQGRGGAEAKPLLMCK